MPLNRYIAGDPSAGGGGDPGTVGWVKTHDLDFTGITPVSQSSASGSGTLAGGDFDGIPYKWNRPSGSAGGLAITEDGMKLTGMAGGSYEAHVDLSTLVNASDDDDFVVAIFVRDIAGINASTEGMRLGISAAGTLASGTNDGMKSSYASASWTPNIMRNDTTTTSYGGTVAIATEGRLTVRLRSGIMAHSAWAAGSSDEPDEAAIDALFLHQISFAAKASEPYSTGLWVGASAYNGADVTVEIYRICIYKRGVV